MVVEVFGSFVYRVNFIWMSTTIALGYAIIFNDIFVF